jgi:hypothetical protein
LFKPWSYQDTFYGKQQGGFLTKFTNYFSFATVHFAGHEVPGYQPERALELFTGYLDGSIFSDATSDSTSSSSESAEEAQWTTVLEVMFSLMCVLLALVIGYYAWKYTSKQRASSSAGAPLPHRGLYTMDDFDNEA